MCHERQNRTDFGIGPRVLSHSKLVGLDPSIARAADGGLEHLAPAVGDTEHVLRARLGPADRPAQMTGKVGDHDVLTVRAVLGPEPSADVGCDDAYVGLVETERIGEAIAGAVRTLGGRPLRQSTVFPHGERGSGLERTGGKPLVDEREGNREITAAERHAPIGLRNLERHVRARFAKEQLLGLQRREGTDDDRQGLVADLDQLGCVDSLLAGMGDHDRDGLADVANGV